jgi:NTE family protein
VGHPGTSPGTPTPERIESPQLGMGPRKLAAVARSPEAADDRVAATTSKGSYMTITEGTKNRATSPRWSLALGGGGAVGMAYIAGALEALADHGVDVPSAGLMVGTSAGAVAAAALRNGATPEEVLTFAQAAPDDVAMATGRAPRHFERAWSHRLGLLHRVVGSSAVIARSAGVPLPMPGPALQALFPAGLFRPRGNGLATRLGDAWPEDPLWVVAVDLATRRRVAIGRRLEDRRLPLHRAVMASCAVPGFYEPVVLGGRRFVDGGVNSTTSIDMAVRSGSSKVIAVVPLGYEPTGRPRAAQRLMRRSAVRGVRRELGRAGNRARDILVIQPHAEDLDLHGINFLRGDANDRVATRARERTHELLQRPEVTDFLGELVVSSIR